MAPARLDELYATLEVPRNADITAIKKSYRSLVLKYHPDKNPEDRETAQKKIRDINAAYAILGNPTKRAQHEQHAQGAEQLVRSATTRSFGEYTTASHRRHDVALPNLFFIQPLGNADKFLRNVDRSFVFHAREDAKGAGFAEFFATATLSIHWLPDANNPDRKAKYGGQCRLQTRPTPGTDGQMLGQPGLISFGLEGNSASDVMLAPINIGIQSPELSDLRLLQSPVFPRAFRFESAFYSGCFLAFDPPTRCFVTSAIDQFTVVDFVIEDVQSAWQFQTLDEVLLPVVTNLGGTVIYVPLAQICQDQSVRTYFQMGMKCEWDFEDFAIYFHAHWEQWDYNTEQRSLRIRKPGEISMGADSKKQVQADGPPTKRAKPNVKNQTPTKVLVLGNMVGAGEVDEDLEEETADEARKFGKLNKCSIKELTGVSDEEAVRIFLEFVSVDSAKKAFDVFDGRIFDGRTVKAWYYDESLFKAGELEK